MRFHVPRCRALELIYLYALVLIICLYLSRFGKRSEFSRFSKSFEVKTVGSVSEGSKWLGYYSTPVIGVVSQDVKLKELVSVSESSAISADDLHVIPTSVVRWLQLSGAQVVPIPSDLPLDRRNEVLNSVNGIVIYSQDHLQESSWIFEALDQTENKPVWIIDDVKLKGPPTADARMEPNNTKLNLNASTVNDHFSPPLDLQEIEALSILSQSLKGNIPFDLTCLDSSYLDASQSFKNFIPVISDQECNLLMKHVNLSHYLSPTPHYLSSQGNENHRIVQQFAGNFFVNRSKTINTYFKESVQFHSKNIENFPTIVDSFGNSFYVVKKLSFDIPCLGKNFNYIC
ncbi:uncharacterized protein LOC134812552 [Bolinopsis microptera]|uniref:uncharacterized protein LOC134812552 n=1 Tax=Bolinopsis microptera TaxID=2820187 RepID=UPI00307A963C